ncbi:hypothetical protein V2J09_011187 [Rumex salicifolius]
MEWWTHLWLNEGFATWISYLAVEIIFPEWKMWTQFILQTNDDLRLDALEESHPIEVEIGHAQTVDAISYKKGSAAIRFLQYYLGNNIFQRSLSSYMKRYACKNANIEDLWEVLSEEAGIQVNRMMNTWTKQKGYPLIFVKLHGHILEFNQGGYGWNQGYSPPPGAPWWLPPQQQPPPIPTWPPIAPPPPTYVPYQQFAPIHGGDQHPPYISEPPPHEEQAKDNMQCSLPRSHSTRLESASRADYSMASTGWRSVSIQPSFRTHNPL